MAPPKKKPTGHRAGKANTPANLARNPTPEAAAAKAEEASRAAESLAEEAGVTPSPAADSKTTATVDDYRAATAALDSARGTYERLAEKVRKDNEVLATQQQKLTSDRTSLAEHQAQIDELRAQLDLDRTALDERREELTALSERLGRQQAEAEAGFLARRDEILAPVSERISELTAAWHERELDLEAQWSKKLDDRATQLDAAHTRRLAELTEAEERIALEQIELDKQRSILERRRAAVDAAQAVLDEDVELFERTKQDAIAHAIREKDAAIDHLETTRERLLDQVRRLEESSSSFGELRELLGEDPDQVMAERSRLLEQLRTARAELSTRPGPEVREELDDARSRLQQAIEDRDESLRAQRELESQLAFQSARLEENERLQLSNSTLQASIAAYRVEIEEYRAQFKQLHDDRETESAFPECAKLEREFASKLPKAGSEVGDLEAFVEDLQVRMAEDRDAAAKGKRLNYRLPDIRLFVAGLAMSHLHLLEGTSGTGKTTLPNAFANAVGGAARKVEVQAGWRDKQDLLGYYNSFERIYRESPCLQYLYKAGLDFFSDQIILIVLDEMNLSHPEQYFADFLSALEDPRKEPLISISDRGLGDVPNNLKSATGVQLRLPSNVWFVGTANQDETTFGFAPKTYDRAHVMELEPNAPAVPKRATSPREPVSVGSLRRAFASAQQEHAAEVERAKSFVHGLAEYFNKEFRVSWGNRLDDHIARFVPVDIAAGGSLGEGLDHLLATKVMRKIQGRHSLRRDALDGLAAQIQDGWIDASRGPERTLEAIQLEIDHLQF